MCTVTWTYSNGGYELFFNRDELRSRGLATQPTIGERNGIRFIAPIDSDAGGTWLDVNQYGITLGILNYYSQKSSAKHSGTFVSRGLLLLSLLDCRSRIEVDERLREIDLKQYRPFVILLLEAQKQAVTFTWDRTTTQVRTAENVTCPLSTSGFMTEVVVKHRAQAFHRMLKSAKSERHIDGEFLRAFHASHDPQKGAYSVCL